MLVFAVCPIVLQLLERRAVPCLEIPRLQPVRLALLFNAQS